MYIFEQINWHSNKCIKQPLRDHYFPQIKIQGSCSKQCHNLFTVFAHQILLHMEVTHYTCINQAKRDFRKKNYGIRKSDIFRKTKITEAIKRKILASQEIKKSKCFSPWSGHKCFLFRGAAINRVIKRMCSSTLLIHISNAQYPSRESKYPKWIQKGPGDRFIKRKSTCIYSHFPFLSSDIES